MLRKFCVLLIRFFGSLCRGLRRYQGCERTCQLRRLLKLLQSELRHLAVRADCRRQGIANALFDAYMSVTGGQKSLVWARTGNEAAERFYETHDYRPDGWNSVVLQYGGTEQ